MTYLFSYHIIASTLFKDLIVFFLLSNIRWWMYLYINIYPFPVVHHNGLYHQYIYNTSLCMKRLFTTMAFTAIIYNTFSLCMKRLFTKLPFTTIPSTIRGVRLYIIPLYITIHICGIIFLSLYLMFFHII